MIDTIDWNAPQAPKASIRYNTANRKSKSIELKEPHVGKIITVHVNACISNAKKVQYLGNYGKFLVEIETERENVLGTKIDVKITSINGLTIYANEKEAREQLYRDSLVGSEIHIASTNKIHGGYLCSSPGFDCHIFLPESLSRYNEFGTKITGDFKVYVESAKTHNGSLSLVVNKKKYDRDKQLELFAAATLDKNTVYTGEVTGCTENNSFILMHDTGIKLMAKGKLPLGSTAKFKFEVLTARRPSITLVALA